MRIFKHYLLKFLNFWHNLEFKNKLFFLSVTSFILSIFFLLVYIKFQFGERLGIFFIITSVILYYFYWAFVNKPNRDITSERSTYKNISVSGGTYVESVAGDSISIQGHTINFINQDLSGFLSDINQVLENLKSQGSTTETAKSSLLNELADESRKNPKFRKKLVRWKKTISNNLQEISNQEAASVIINIPFSSLWKAVDKKEFFDEIIYARLDSLLKIGDWEEADKETSAVIINVLTLIYGEEFPNSLKENVKNSSDYSIWELEDVDCNIDGLSSDHIIDIPSKDLRYIDYLWNKYSGGKFGFSVQKSIFIKMFENSGYLEFIWEYGFTSEIESFAELIGWYRNGFWIYYSDVGFSLKNPEGHLPSRVLIHITCLKDKRAKLSIPITKALCGRQYE